jgi:VIT1/CCC1 family predicted Fe2+/Mn2+ transporter
MGKTREPFITGPPSMNSVRLVDSNTVKILLRGVAVIVAAALIILPAYFNYEIWKAGFNPVVSMAISLQLFAIGIVILILAVGKDRLAPKSQPQ